MKPSIHPATCRCRDCRYPQRAFGVGIRPPLTRRAKAWRLIFAIYFATLAVGSGIITWLIWGGK